MKTRRKLLRCVALAAAMALPAAFSPGGVLAQQGGNGEPPTKVFKIYNSNLTGSIYPVISTPKQGVDLWLQAEFQTLPANLKTHKFGNENVYRIYINPTKGGIPPGGSVELRVPLYTQLKKTDQGKEPDEFIDWWNGGRLSLYDVEEAISKDLAEDKKSPTKPLDGATLVTCLKGCVEPLDIYQSAKDKGDLPANDPTQLTEYSLGGIDEEGPKQSPPRPIKFLPEKVNYDISYVDQVYLPVAMEPLGNLFIGWIGTTQNIETFRNGMENFLTSETYPGWPTYLDDKGEPFLRIPSTGTIYAAESGAHPSPDLSRPGASFEATQEFWENCTLHAGKGKDCKKIRNVLALYLANWENYLEDRKNENCKGKLPDEPDIKKMLLPHVYGWVPFNETPPQDECDHPITNEIYKTPGYNGKAYQAVQDQYKELQYSTKGGVFNPYVQLVHFAPYLDMANAYAFSIDDSVGNMDTTGKGLIITVGGGAGLDNPAPFDLKKKVEVTAGAEPDPKATRMKEFGFCAVINGKHSCEPSTPYPGLAQSFNLQTVTYPTEVTLMDTSGVLYTFIIKKGPPYPEEATADGYIECVTQEAWCKGSVKVSTTAPTDPKIPVVNAVVTPPPLQSH